MQVPGVEGHNMSTIEDGPEEGAEANGTENEGTETNNDVVAEPKDGAGDDGGAAAGDVGEDAPTEEGEVPQEEGVPEPEIEPAAALDPEAFKKDIIDALKKELKPEQVVKPMSDEEWAAQEQAFGVPRTAIERFTNMAVQVQMNMTKYIDQKFDELKQGDIVASLSKEKGFQDAPRYKKGMDEFLNDVDPRSRKNPDVVKKAYYYAKGQAASANVQKARTEGERNRRIGGVGRPASPGTPKKVAASRPLTAEQKSVAATFGMSEAEYAKNRQRVPIAI